jgi:hypothetical protein
MKGTSAPQERAILEIFVSSVVTITLSHSVLSNAVKIVHSINGRPRKYRQFLFGIPFDPPRAGTTASDRFTADAFKFTPKNRTFNYLSTASVSVRPDRQKLIMVVGGQVLREECYIPDVKKYVLSSFPNRKERFPSRDIPPLFWIAGGNYLYQGSFNR